MVRCIQLAIPPGMEDMYNPIKDAELMALIGAKLTKSYVFIDKTIVGSIYELKNEATGTTYVFGWWCKDSKQYFSIEKKTQSAT